MSFPGGKNGAGTWQQIINQQPPHRTYIEPFLGSGAVMFDSQWTQGKIKTLTTSVAAKHLLLVIQGWASLAMNRRLNYSLTNNPERAPITTA